MDVPLISSPNIAIVWEGTNSGTVASTIRANRIEQTALAPTIGLISVDQTDVDQINTLNIIVGAIFGDNAIRVVNLDGAELNVQSDTINAFVAFGVDDSEQGNVNLFSNQIIQRSNATSNFVENSGNLNLRIQCEQFTTTAPTVSAVFFTAGRLNFQTQLFTSAGAGFDVGTILTTVLVGTMEVANRTLTLTSGSMHFRFARLLYSRASAMDIDSIVVDPETNLFVTGCQALPSLAAGNAVRFMSILGTTIATVEELTTFQAFAVVNSGNLTYMGKSLVVTQSVDTDTVYDQINSGICKIKVETLQLTLSNPTTFNVESGDANIKCESVTLSTTALGTSQLLSAQNVVPTRTCGRFGRVDILSATNPINVIESSSATSSYTIKSITLPIDGSTLLTITNGISHVFVGRADIRPTVGTHSSSFVVASGVSTQVTLSVDDAFTSTGQLIVLSDGAQLRGRFINLSQIDTSAAPIITTSDTATFDLQGRILVINTSSNGIEIGNTSETAINIYNIDEYTYTGTGIAINITGGRFVGDGCLLSATGGTGIVLGTDVAEFTGNWKNINANEQVLDIFAESSIFAKFSNALSNTTSVIRINGLADPTGIEYAIGGFLESLVSPGIEFDIGGGSSSPDRTILLPTVIRVAMGGNGISSNEVGGTEVFAGPTSSVGPTSGITFVPLIFTTEAGAPNIPYFIPV
jgi:hypothetical protein